MNKEHKHIRIISKMSPERILKRMREQAEKNPLMEILKKQREKEKKETE